MLKPIPHSDRLSLTNLPAITFGAGTFSGQYDFKVDSSINGLIHEAYRLGLRAFDTSPYYGDSEKILGQGLRSLLASGVPREELFIMTKCGRYGVWEFDYSPASIFKSVRRSCKRLGVDYLDVVYLHDVEFVGAEQVLAAAGALFMLKRQGIVRNVGISGYPLQVLEFLAGEIAKSHQPLDILLSYSHYNIQNTTLVPQIPKFKATGIKAVLSASPLSMGLLKEGGPPEWHPASPTLKNKIVDAVDYLKNVYDGQYTMANVAVGYAIKNAPRHDLESTVIGFCRIPELHEAVSLYWEIHSGNTKKASLREVVEDQVIDVIEPVLNETWPSPPEMGRLVDPAPHGFVDEGDV